jgi:spore coat polysaccharide biosynthesis predicted glycosyltransferase SpsG
MCKKNILISVSGSHVETLLNVLEKLENKKLFLNQIKAVGGADPN